MYDMCVSLTYLWKDKRISSFKSLHLALQGCSYMLNTIQAEIQGILFDKKTPDFLE
jgi:hypothetical protein